MTNLPCLPFELLVEIFEHLNLPLLENIQDPRSLTYWPLNRWVLVDNACDTTSIMRKTLTARLPFLLVNRQFHAAMTMALKGARAVVVLDSEGFLLAQQNIADERQRRGKNWGLEHLAIRMNQLMAPAVSELVRDHSRTLQFLTLHHSAAWNDRLPADFWPSFYSLPSLNTFVYRVQLDGPYVTLGEALQIMAAAPHLAHLTLFELYGTVLTPAIYPTHCCQLRSLHLRGPTFCSEDDLRMLLGNSHKTLKELTFVFEYQTHGPDFGPEHGPVEPMHRGLRTSTVQAAFSPCVGIRILRVGDMVTEETANCSIRIIQPLNPSTTDDVESPVDDPNDQLVYPYADDMDDQDDQLVYPYSGDFDEPNDHQMVALESEPINTIHPQRFEDINDEPLGPIPEAVDVSGQQMMDLADEDNAADEVDSDAEGDIVPSPPASVDDAEDAADWADFEAEDEQRLADWVLADSALYADEFDEDNTPLATMVDVMVRNLAELEILEIYGALCSAGLFENLRRSGCALAELTIYQYPAFPLAALLQHLRDNNPALAKLRVLTFGRSVAEHQNGSTDWEELQQLCQERQIALRVLTDF